MPPELVARTDGPSILLDKPILLFGRDLECDVRFDSRKISRKHCCIAQVGDYLAVRDLGSTNGIRINGVRVLEGQLHPGDELTVGNFLYQVRWDEQALAARPPARPAPRPNAHDATAQPHDDEMLERCDEPVPLADYPGGSDLPEAKPVSMPDQVIGRPSSHAPILPEHLSLAPSSDHAMPRREPG